MYSRNTVRTIICLTVSYGTFSVRYAQSVVPLPEVEAGITATLGVPDRTPAVGVPHVGSVTLRPKKNQHISYNGLLIYDVFKFGLPLVTYNLRKCARTEKAYFVLHLSMGPLRSG